MSFDSIYGHSTVKKQLTDIVNNNTLSHAYIFSGPMGVGKYDIAKAWAQMITNGHTADIKEVTNENYCPSKKTASLSVDAVRNATADMYLKPFVADKSVYVIPHGETMSIPAQNALLKTFEEPPRYCVIIIITDNYEELLPTIRSRAVNIRFGKLTEQEISGYLKDKGYKYSDVVTALADGSINKAVTLCENGETLDLCEKTLGMLSDLFYKNGDAKYRLINFLQQNKDSINVILDTFIVFFQQSVLQLCEKNVTIPFRVPDGKTSARCIGHIERCKKALKSNVNYNMTVSELVLELTQ
ncbi:MAG: hypothetical protein J6V58_04730 [Clostridia bacterium]|nr:hypothetical protein [Clostridia bacterium]